LAIFSLRSIASQSDGLFFRPPVCYSAPMSRVDPLLRMRRTGVGRADFASWTGVFLDARAAVDPGRPRACGRTSVSPARSPSLAQSDVRARSPGSSKA